MCTKCIVPRTRSRGNRARHRRVGCDNTAAAARATSRAPRREELDVKRSGLVVVTCLWSAGTAFAEDIERVEIRGNHRVEADLIRSAVGTKAGRALDATQLRADLRAIWKLGRFSDVQAVTDGGVIA